uniref:Alpha-1-antiproteinase n=1 Tax=Callorhinchus milii TaxID=7868 RepID=K4GGW6_CALMI|nr:Alpha-1-antiproteinase [Callorhinchus milii]
MKLLPVLVVLIVASSSGAEAHSQPMESPGDRPPADMATISAANSDFAFHLYKTITNHSTSNIFFSPLSISFALAMLSLGTRSASREQLLGGLHFKNMTQDRRTKMNTGFKNLLQTLTMENSNFLLSTGNSLHIQKDFAVRPGFLNETKKFYNADVFNLDFSLDPEGATQQINNYIKKVTNGKIQKLFDSIEPATKLMLINYMFFKGKWKNPFDPAHTAVTTFQTDDGKTVNVPMMFKRGRFQIVFDRNLFCTVVKLVYLGNISMIAILPTEHKLAHVEENLSREWLEQLHCRSSFINLYFPKLMVKNSYQLNDILMEMGVTDVFTSHADLSGISESVKLKVSQITHDAVLEVDEKGTEATSVTTVGIMTLSFPALIKFDRPFLLMIYEETTKSILFLGRIKDPSERASS